MTSFEWISMIVPIICNFIFSGIIILIFNKKVERHFTRKDAKEHYAFIVMQDLKNHVEKLKMHIIKMQNGVIEINNEALQHFFYISGDLQVYVDDYEEYLQSYEHKHPSFFMLSELRQILDNVIAIGISIQQSNIDNSIGNYFSSALIICTKVIKSYNYTLACIK